MYIDELRIILEPKGGFQFLFNPSVPPPQSDKHQLDTFISTKTGI